MKKIKVLNLYAGIGGNRKLWENVDVTAVEIDQSIADEYQRHFPNDNVIVSDAHDFLLRYYKEFDFIWSSPPCPTHSDIRRAGAIHGQYEVKYPDMKLYEEIIFLRHFCRCKWVVENVKPYYNPLIRPFEVHRHYFWSNFIITKEKIHSPRKHNDVIGTSTVYGFNISKTTIADKRKVLRNMVDPQLGLHVFNCAFKEHQRTL